ncbi:MAG: hypothetical protein M5U15_00865 [Kiritimatiellae bacterium]|nr:hypothetical protein [Kiritimatiellia bacterium]
MLTSMFTRFHWDVQSVNMLTALVLFSAPLWFVQWLEVKTNDLSAATKLSLIPKTALYATMIIMFLALGNTGGGAFIYFQF